jgi:hypothetical protein
MATKRKRGRPSITSDSLQSLDNNNDGSSDSPAIRRKRLRLLQAARADAKADHEALKRRVFASLTDKYKNTFNEIGYAKWGKEELPALVVSPFDVPPGVVRDQWMQAYDNVSKQC